MVAPSSDVSEAIRLALNGVHVNLTGPRGSDLPSVLDEIGASLETRGLDVVRLDGSPSLVAAVLAPVRLALPEVVGDARDQATVIDRFCLHLAELRSPFLIVSNIDAVDPFTLRAIEAGVRRGRAILISSLTSATAAFPDVEISPHTRLVIRRLSHMELSNWLATLTDHPIEQELITRIYLDSGGSPVFARALWESAVREELVVLQEGWWRLFAAELWTPQVSFAVERELSSLAGNVGECLRSVHLAGTPPVAEVVGRFPLHALSGLEREGLLGVVRTGFDEPVFVVMPPVVSRHLDAEAGDLVTASRDDAGDGAIQTEAIAALELDRATQVRATAARTRFDADPSAAHAIELVNALWARWVPYQEAAPVFAAARTGEDPDDDFSLLVLHALWLAFGEGHHEAGAAVLIEAEPSLPERLKRYAAAHRIMIDIHWAGMTEEVHERLESLRQSAFDDGPVGTFARLTVASACVVAGRAARALGIVGEDPNDAELSPFWTVVFGQASMAIDEPARAISAASTALDRARAALDAPGVFCAGYLLVGAHMFLGNWAQAQAISRAIRVIGRPNLHAMPIYRTAVGVQAIVFAEEGDLDSASGLMMRAIRAGDRAPLALIQQPMPVVVRLLAEQRYEELADALATAAQAALASGSESPSATLWAFALGNNPWLYDRSPATSPGVELFAYERFRRFIGEVVSEDMERTRVAAESLPESTFAYLAAVALVHASSRFARTDPARAAEYLELMEQLCARLSIAPPAKVMEGPAPVLGLTARELEIAMMAARLSNRDIADRLGISERTVDHHVSNALKKTAARNRHELSALVMRVRRDW